MYRVRGNMQWPNDLPVNLWCFFIYFFPFSKDRMRASISLDIIFMMTDGNFIEFHSTKRFTKSVIGHEIRMPYHILCSLARVVRIQLRCHFISQFPFALICLTLLSIAALLHSFRAGPSERPTSIFHRPCVQGLNQMTPTSAINRCRCPAFPC